MSDYDIAIVGGGLSGALLAWSLTKNQPGLKVIVLEAGPTALDANGNVNRQSHIDTFYASPTKFPEAPYPPGSGAPSPDVADLLNEEIWNDPSQSYFTYPQKPQPPAYPYQSTYERLQGGTAWHWLGTTLRLIDNDFKLYSTYLKQSGIGSPANDWPIGYADLAPFYEAAEAAIGVSADVEDQRYPHGPPFRSGYEFPMKRIPPSYLDQVLAGSLNGFVIPNFDASTPLTVRSTPQARNSAAYNGRPPCMGNTNCVPICPIGAKYDPMVHVLAAMEQGAVFQNQSVVFNIILGSDNKTIAGIQYMTYDGTVQPTVTAKLYIIAAHAVETPRLLLLSNPENGGLANSSGQVGRNIMDHNTQLSWALMPDGKPVYGYRAPLATSGIEELRDGAFRSTRGAFRIEIGNDGWNWPTGAPATDVINFVGQQRFGSSLREALNDWSTRQFRVASLVEPLGVASNRVTLSDTYKDPLGLPRPEIAYQMQDYEINGLIAARQAAIAIFAQLGATDFTTPAAAAPEGFFGAGHILGTARMGSDPKTSVTDSYGRTWDHPNLFLVGAPMFPSVGCMNPSLTIAALALRSAQYISDNWSTVASS
jgi:choline dehydrogenase-like flavoprotein